MSTINDGGPAFPTQWNESDNSGWKVDDGMSLRDWFAGRVLGAAMTSANGLGNLTKEERALAFAQVAVISYEAADAMIAAREK